MKFLLIENQKSLYEEYLLTDKDKEIKYSIIGKKEIDEILEIYKGSLFTKIKIKKINYFGQTNFEIYYDEEFITIIGEEINLFKDIYYFDFNGWKLIYDERKIEYVVTDINDKIIFKLKKPVENIRDNYELEICNLQDILGVITISVIMFIYNKH